MAASFKFNAAFIMNKKIKYIILSKNIIFFFKSKTLPIKHELFVVYDNEQGVIIKFYILNIQTINTRCIYPRIILYSIC